VQVQAGEVKQRRKEGKKEGRGGQLTPPSTVAIATAGAEEGVLVRQGSRLDLEDGVCIGILRRDGGTALALAH
jgi:hypothetical protein